MNFSWACTCPKCMTFTCWSCSKLNVHHSVVYRPPDKEEAVDKALLLQPQEVSRLQALVLMEDFNHPDICWQDNMVSCKRSRRLLESINDNFLVQVLDRPEVKHCWNCCSPTWRRFLKILRMEVAWAAVPMSWSNLWSRGTQAWQRMESGPWNSGEWNTSCIRSCWMKSPGKFYMGTKKYDITGNTLRMRAQ